MTPDTVDGRVVGADTVATMTKCRLVKTWERLRVLTMLVEEEMERRMDDERH